MTKRPLGALLAAVFLGLTAWQLGRRGPLSVPRSGPVDQAAVPPPRS